MRPIVWSTSNNLCWRNQPERASVRFMPAKPWASAQRLISKIKT